MDKIDLTINYEPIQLGLNKNDSVFNNIKLRRLDLIGRIIIKKKPYDKIFWVKNTAIACFGKDFILMPFTEQITYNSNLAYGTSAYFFFNHNKLSKISLQLIGNKIRAEWAKYEFDTIMTNMFGNPQIKDNLNIWTLSESFIISERLKDSSNFHFHWVLME